MIAQKEFKIRVLGVGGAGCNAVTHLAREPLAGVSFAVLNTDSAALSQLPLPERVILGQQAARGLGAGGNVELGRAAAEEEAAAIRALCEGVDLVVIVAGLGGGTGSGAAPVVARIARDCKALVLGIALMPFDFEGAARQRQAVLALEDLRTASDGVICLPNQKLLKLVDQAASFAESLATMNGFVAEAMKSIWNLIVRPGIVPLGFANLCAVTRGRHAENCFAIARGEGDHRAREAVDRVIKHPLLEGGALLAESTTVLVSIVAGAGLSMAEVHEVMQRISRAADSAHIIMGAAIDESLVNALTVTLIAGRSEMHDATSSRLVAFVPCNGESSEEKRPLLSNSVAGPQLVGDVPGIDEAAQRQAARARKPGQRMRQGQLPLDIISRGRFEKSEPTIYHGQDLDVPTYIRRGVALN